MVGTVAGDGAPSSFFGSPLDSPFSFSDSPLDGPRPFLLPMFQPELPFFFGIAVLADSFYCNRHRFTSFPRRRTTGIIVPLAEVCICTSLLPVPNHS